MSSNLVLVFWVYCYHDNIFCGIIVKNFISNYFNAVLFSLTHSTNSIHSKFPARVMILKGFCSTRLTKKFLFVTKIFRDFNPSQETLC